MIHYVGCVLNRTFKFPNEIICVNCIPVPYHWYGQYSFIIYFFRGEFLLYHKIFICIWPYNVLEVILMIIISGRIASKQTTSEHAINGLLLNLEFLIRHDRVYLKFDSKYCWDNYNKICSLKSVTKWWNVWGQTGFCILSFH